MSRLRKLRDQQAQLYPQAAHCYEELLLHTPQSAPLHVQYADVLYTMGGGHLRMARQHYAAAVKLSNGESLRSLYGICCTAAALAGQKVIIVVARHGAASPESLASGRYALPSSSFRLGTTAGFPNRSRV